MSEEKKPKKTRRPAAEIAAEKKAWLIRHEWHGPKEALVTLVRVTRELDEAQAACGEKVDEAAPMWKTLQGVLGEVRDAVEAAIPPEAR